MSLKLSTLKREICQHTNGKFRFLTVYGARIIPEQNAIALITQYEFSWRRTPEKWGSFVMAHLKAEYPEVNFVLLSIQEIEPEWPEKKKFEAIVQIKI